MKSLAFIGCGRLATALAPRLAQAGYPIEALASRDGRSAGRLRRRLGAGDVVSPEDTPSRADVLLFAVPDEQIEALSTRIAAAHDSLRGKVALHFAGALGPDALAPLKRKGSSTAVLHPLQAFGDPADTDAILADCPARIEGEGAGLSVARQLLRRLGMKRLDLPARMTPRQRRLYHAAASVAANDLLGLIKRAAGLLESLGLEADDAEAALMPIAGTTLRQAAKRGIGPALTGPVSRGDAETVAGHLAAMDRGHRSAGEIHRLLSRELIEIAAEDGRLDRAARQRLRRVLNDRDRPRRGQDSTSRARRS